MYTSVYQSVGADSEIEITWQIVYNYVVASIYVRGLHNLIPKSPCGLVSGHILPPSVHKKHSEHRYFSIDKLGNLNVGRKKVMPNTYCWLTYPIKDIYAQN